ncbi:MAG: fructose-bisphosphate aldolase [Desulfonauticus sp.]|nr:fructose-bisphosphate aldolase [Desulfonauticus sp.]
MLGIFRKRKQLFNPKSQKTVFLSLDYGFNDGMFNNLNDVKELFGLLARTRLNGLILPKGLAKEWVHFVPLDFKIIINLSASTKHGLPYYNKTIVCSAAEALRLGADAVAIHLNIGNDLEDKMLQDFGLVVDEAHQLGLPVLATIYARGGQIVNELDPSLVAHCIGLGAEIGADLIAVPFPGRESVCTNAVQSCPVPVLFDKGANKTNFSDFLAMLKQSLANGLVGLKIGQYLFKQTNPLKSLESILKLVHDN